MIGATAKTYHRTPYGELVAAAVVLVFLVIGAWLWQRPQTVSVNSLTQELKQWNTDVSATELLAAGYIDVTNVHDYPDATIEHFLEEANAGRQSVLHVFSQTDGDIQIRVLWFDPYVTGDWISRIEGTHTDVEQAHGLIRELRWRAGDVDGSSEYYAREPERITEGSETQVLLARRFDATSTTWMEGEMWPEPTPLYSYRL
ncbi:hypothetical protein [Bifidobacterium aerophilum]|uniref:Uncharacterized protein n=1 Tax=Bifidobacterium aerophilum TaxID=1798155 RepID=A0A6N9Z2L7_9BIFI|nr:hypothetical protein [Bifidobacterium aerophilum]NEG88731.1 hypothetical protein [Bifidobacterium aerophilum]